jgi:hypothetical protein
VFNTAKKIAQAVRLEELVRSADAEFQQILGDSVRSTPLPATTPPPSTAPAAPPAKTGAPPAAKKKP